MASRYLTSYEDTVTGESIVVAVRPNYANKQYFVYRSLQGDTFAILAYRYLGDETLFWVIADLNPHIKVPDEIPINSSIRIPLT